MKNNMKKNFYILLLCFIVAFCVGGCKVLQSFELKPVEPIIESNDSENKTDDNLVEVYVDKDKADDSLVEVYVDEDRTDNNLTIRKNADIDSFGTYDVKIDIFRLAGFRDRDAIAVGDVITFRAIDPAGNPIMGIISFEDGKAIVTFTDSTWNDIENNAKFTYYKEQ